MNKSLTTVKVKGGLHLKTLSSILKMDIKDLIKINRHIKKNILPKDVKYYDVNIPFTKLRLYNLYKNSKSIKERTKVSGKKVIYKVKKTDTLDKIALKYKINIEKLKKDNKLKSDVIKIGDKIEIYK